MPRSGAKKARKLAKYSKKDNKIELRIKRVAFRSLKKKTYLNWVKGATMRRSLTSNALRLPSPRLFPFFFFFLNYVLIYLFFSWLVFFLEVFPFNFF